MPSSSTRPPAQISVNQGATLDYEDEDNRTYTGQVTWKVQGQDAAADLTINVTDVEATMPGAPRVTRKRSSAPMNPALNVNWTAANANGLTITGYNVQYRIKGEADWTLYEFNDPANPGTPISLLPATARYINLPNRASGTTYEARVRAVTTGEGAGPWSATGEGRANTPPSLVNAIVHGNGNFSYVGDSFDVPIKNFADADGDRLYLSGEAQHPARLGVSSSGEAADFRLTFSLLNQGMTTFSYRVRDSYGGQYSYSGDFKITHLVLLSLHENSPRARSR